MAIVLVSKPLEEEINKKFKKEAIKIFSLMKEYEKHPKKGKALGTVGEIVIKEFRYNTFRLYFITDGYKVKFLKNDDLQDLMIKFVRMSDKKNQQKTIDEIKSILRLIGSNGFQPNRSA